MLGSIKDQGPTINTHGCDNVWVLGLVSGLVNLSRVINLLVDGHFDASAFTVGVAITSNFLAVLVVLIGIGRDVVWKLDACNFEVVWLAFRSVRTNEETMDTIVLPGRSMTI